MVPTFYCVLGGGLNKGIVVPDHTSVPATAAPPNLPLKPNNSVYPHMSLVLFKLLPEHCISEWVSPLVSICTGPLRVTPAGGRGGEKGNPCNSSSSPSHLTEYLLIFKAKCCEDSCSLYWWSRLGSTIWVWDSHSSGGTSAAEVFLLIIFFKNFIEFIGKILVNKIL